MDSNWLRTPDLCRYGHALYSDGIKNDGSMIRNIKVHVGNAPAKYGQLSENQVCAELDGVIMLDSLKVLPCDQIVSGRYVLIQMQNDNGGNGFALQEVIVFFALSSDFGNPKYSADLLDLVELVYEFFRAHGDRCASW